MHLLPSDCWVDLGPGFPRGAGGWRDALRVKNVPRLLEYPVAKHGEARLWELARAFASRPRDRAGAAARGFSRPSGLDQQLPSSDACVRCPSAAAWNARAHRARPQGITFLSLAPLQGCGATGKPVPPPVAWAASLWPELRALRPRLRQIGELASSAVQSRWGSVLPGWSTDRPAVWGSAHRATARRAGRRRALSSCTTITAKISSEAACCA